MERDKAIGMNVRKASALALAACLVVPAYGQQADDALAQGFVTPPASARPRVWWHWMNGNITKEGITQDLEWMHRVGIAGFQNFDAAFQTPKVVDKRLIYMTPEWKDAFRFAIEKGNALGMEMAVAGSPGWSETGGPWVKPEQAMKKVVWSETAIEGGKPFHGKLDAPPTATGPYGNMAQQDLMGQMGSEPAKPAEDYGAATITLAIREPEAESSVAMLKPEVSGSRGALTGVEKLYDNDMNSVMQLQSGEPGQTTWLLYTFAKPVTMQSATYAAGPPFDPLALFRGETNDGPVLQSSSDGATFTDVVRFPTAGAAHHTMSFAPVTARYFRLSFKEKAADTTLNGMDLGDLAPKTTGPMAHGIAEFNLFTGPRVNRGEEKAAYAPVPDLYGFATPQESAGSAIAKADVIDLTAKVAADGTLDWTPPAGRWTVLRMGYSLTGITNHPAPPEATGPEVDKLDKADVQAYFNHYLDNYKDATGGLMGKQGLRYVITDSWEAGAQNWTNAMLPEFKKRRGYDATPWMPVIAGRVVGSAAESDRFLWDYRRTIEELLAENHYAAIATMLHERGMGQYGESHEAGRATIGDGMEMKKNDDVPMSATWVQRPGVNEPQYGYDADVRESASVAHIYGQNLVAAESMTAAQAPWGWSPQTLKPTADMELANGLNRFVIHSSVHQPLTGPGGADDGSPAPGLTLGPFGQWFNRNETWAEQAGPWINYLARSSYMLQQGKFVANLAYYYGEDSNLTAIFDKKGPDVPAGYTFDYVNADILENMLRVDHGMLVTKTGMQYGALVLDGYSAHMSLPVLKRLQTLVKEGATVIGKAPVNDPSLADNQQEFAAIVRELWGADGAGTKAGKGRVMGGAVADGLKAANVMPDTSYTQSQPESKVLFVHRRTPEAEIYYVDNRVARPERTEVTFAVSGKVPELWHADTGVMEAVSYKSAGGKTTVPLTLDPYGTVFVVFKRATKETLHDEPVKTETAVAKAAGPWEVRFEEKRGEPGSLHLDTLSSWSDNADKGVRYFSGHADYSTKMTVADADLKSGRKLWLDLGDVANLAEVKVNGKALGIVWKAPYRVDVSNVLHAGENTLEIRVVNLWVNRLIGDAQPDVKTKYTFTASNPYKANSPLVPAGLLGPVQVIAESSGR